ncbi:MAG: non-canonical purine NTP pyrophosphatase, RdgB/HAM1 family [Marine Group III euryarchaeote CG-Bathy1]|uniref:dITP/XTP pyrophosphatase n=1 Tax=Marine Group III euryarchaeote CG-Bathy1 TaxID=1889001 RepID=A0A1J5TE00_9ARCH|nr:MAG: non-canonical purine NTP pyrophosphatase, RdgB/HAM1 family [Marine Group III euryarchaeote CG-Bathy1]
MKIHLITSNKGKVEELSAMLTPLGHETEQTDLQCPELQANNLEEVIVHGLEWLKDVVNGENVLIDDAGVFIEALGGFPGVYSRYAYDTIGLSGILKLMEGIENRRASFKCVLGFLQSNGTQYVLAGETHGTLTHKEKGEEGFGYDPIFIPDGEEKTFAELDMNRKNQLSHRGKALNKLLDILSSIE